MTEQNLSELETKILNCVRYSPHSMSVKPTQAIELIAYILAIQAQPTPSQSVGEVVSYLVNPNNLSHKSMKPDLVFNKPNHRTDYEVIPLYTKPQSASQDYERKRLLYLYKKTMDKLVKPLMSFDDWLNEIDKAMKESEL